MLANSFPDSISTGIPDFTHSVKLTGIYETTLLEAVPEFIHGLVAYPKTKSMNEDGFTQEYEAALNRVLFNNPKGVLVGREYKDYSTLGANPLKQVDIAFYPMEMWASKKALYTVEAKRLPTGKGKRKKEYVSGLFSKSASPSGGIQRFKTEDHGCGLSKSAMLGYVEEYDFSYWHNTINVWIADKAKELPAEWIEDERLQNLIIDPTEICSVCRSVANRKSDSIELFHLWIKIPKPHSS